MPAEAPIQLGLAGLGGYAGFIWDQLKPAGPSSGAGLEVTAACEPFSSPEVNARKSALQAAGVPVVASFDQLLQQDIQAVWLPVPIDLHRPFTQQALSAGKAVMCEKPAAGCVDDLDAMIAARNATRLPVAIGFQHIYDPANLALKRRILAGDIGTPRYATLVACWPRPESYYRRAAWAGALKRNGAWVLDSPANNALAHYINLALFLLGPLESQSTDFVDVEAELYRAHRIENYDTISLRLTLDHGCTFLALLTHACQKTVNPILVIHGERGSLCWDLNTSTATLSMTGKPPLIQPVCSGPFRDMAARFAALIRNQPDSNRAVATLEVARAHLAAVNVASQIAAVHDVPPRAFRMVDGEPGRLYAITGIEEIFARAARRRLMLHETQECDWTVPAKRVAQRGRDYRHFAGPP